MADDLATGEIARWLERLDKGQEEMLRRFDAIRTELVTRSEWGMQNRIQTQDIADVENKVRDLADQTEKRLEALAEQVGSHRDVLSRVKGVQWVLGVILGVVVTIVAAYIQSGRM